MCCLKLAGVKKDLLQIVQRLQPLLLTFRELFTLLTPDKAEDDEGDWNLVREDEGLLANGMLPVEAPMRATCPPLPTVILGGKPPRETCGPLMAIFCPK